MIRSSAVINPSAVIGRNTKVWDWAQICAGARVGDDCIIGSGVYIDREVVIGNRVKIQTGAQLYRGAIIDDGVFVGPLVCMSNDKHPRAITARGQLKTDADWEMGKTHVCYGASLGAGSVVLANVTVGKFGLVGAGALVAETVPDYGLVVGVPARLVGYVCACGYALRKRPASDANLWTCSTCDTDYLRLGDSGLCPASEHSVESPDEYHLSQDQVHYEGV